MGFTPFPAPHGDPITTVMTVHRSAQHIVNFLALESPDIAAPLFKEVVHAGHISWRRDDIRSNRI